MWGSRTRHAKRNKKLITQHDFKTVRVNARKKIEDMEIEKTDNIVQLKAKRAKLTTKLPKLLGRKHIRTILEIRSQIDVIEKKLEYYESDLHIAEFVELMQPILNKDGIENTEIKQAKHAMYLKIFYPDKAVPCFSDRDLCSQCHVELKMISNESMVICPACGFSEHLIFCNSDFIDNRNVKNNTYERAPLYRKYLMQYHEDEPDIPAEVINVVYKHLSKVHIMSSSTVKSTPIAQILRQEGYQKYTCKSVRIAKIINNEPIVKMSSELIERLVWRFKRVTAIFTGSKKKNVKKLLILSF